ncbi:MAG: c-type cytochrome domain-containing protein, partial [Verrucomicrobiota bacterium]
MDLVALLGRFHPIVLHLPIGALMTIALNEVYLFYRPNRSENDHSLVFTLYLFASGTSILAIITGLILSQESSYGGSALELHKRLGIFVGLVTFVTTAFAFACLRAHQDRVQKWIALRRIGMMISIILISAAGHIGGELTHGKDFLTEYAPEFVKQLTGTDLVPSPLIITEESTVFEVVIDPILTTHCVYCHDDSTTKGGLKMNTREGLLTGGSSGLLFIPESAEKSLMMQRIHLPLDHDKHMPPTTKRQPSEEQIAALAWWINHGASFELKWDDPDVPESVRSLANSVQTKEKKNLAASLSSELDLAAIQKLRDQFVAVQRVSQGSHFLWVDFSAIASTTDDSMVEALSPIAEQVIWLNLARTQITDNSLITISQMTNLQELNLSNTQ